MNQVLEKAPQVVLLVMGSGAVLCVLIAVLAGLTGHTLDTTTAALVDKMLMVGVGAVGGAGTVGMAVLQRANATLQAQIKKE